MKPKSSANSVESTKNQQFFNQKTIFKYVSAICGSGKTYSALEYIITHLPSARILITGLSTDFCDQVANDLLDRKAINVKTIHSKNNNDNNVKQAAVQYAKEINKLGQGVEIITSATFLNMADYELKQFEGWYHFMDEVFNPVEIFTFDLPYEHHIITDRLILTETPDFPEHYRVTAKSKSDLEKIIKRKYDKHSSAAKGLFKHLINGNYSVRISKDIWNSIVVDKKIYDDPAYLKYHPEGSEGFRGGNDNNKLVFIATLRPIIEKYFKDVIILGAFAEKTRLFTFWHDKYNIEFQLHDEIISNLRTTEHKNGHLLNIHYGQERAFSRTQARTKHDDLDVTGVEIHIKQALEVIDPTKDTLCLCNVSDQSLCPDNWIQLTNNSHGLNSYDHVTQFVFLGNFAYSPLEKRELIKRGFTEDAIQFDLMTAPIYQTLSRSSFRNINSTELLTMYCASKVNSFVISEMIGGCNLIAIDGIKEKVVGKIGKTAAQRKLKYNMRLILKNYETDGPTNLLERFLHNINVKGKAKEYFDQCNDADFELSEANVGLNCYFEKFLPGDLCIQSMLRTFNELATAVRIATQKESARLINFVIFDDAIRQSKAAVGTQVMVFDIDGGGMTPEQANIILHDIEGLSYFAHSTFSHQLKDEQSRFRIIIPVNTFLVPAVYEIIYDHFLTLFEKHNFYTAPHKSDKQKFIEKMRKINPLAKLSGIDLSKRNLSSIFYLPTIAAGNEHCAFSYKSYLTKAELNEHCLNVFSVLRGIMANLKEQSKSQEVDYEMVVERDETNKRELTPEQIEWSKALSGTLYNKARIKD